ncbi:MAG TPA: N-acetylmuramoyl-L-alanine amidase [Longimicrobium sp.]|jgi:N-acetylmuramoyl-L-alanine amidase|uniref:N-acetylmuramoyl-L-alanine amidase family protein n=1 Tax=Longimicrobium sp. TaxID=2029185 RepID=UPI002ED83826
MQPRLVPRAAVLAAVLAACDGGAPPAVPPVDGPLALAVRHPGPTAALVPGGFAYLAGSAGSGRARVTVDGVPVTLHPNGSFAAYLPVPGRRFYEVMAVRGGDTVRLRHPVAAVGDLSAVDGTLRVDPSSVHPRGEIAAAPEERVAVSVRATANASVWVQWPGGRQPLAPPHPSLFTAPKGAADRWSGHVLAGNLTAGATLVVARGGDTVRLPLPRAAAIPPGTQVELRAGPEGVTPASDTPDGHFAWLLLPGTRLPVTGWGEGHTRVRLDARHEAWVRDALAAPLSPAAVTERVVREARLVARPDRVELRVEMGVAEPPPFRVEEGAQEIALVLYGARMAGSPPAAGADPMVRSVEARAEPGGGTRLVVRLAGQPYGYAAAWRDGRFILALRRPPPVARRRPLRGLTVAVDAGHPPHGAVGPTGLGEAEVTLAVARRLARELERRGARVVMTREGTGPVALEARVAIARRAGAHALVSLHADAVPSSVNAAEVAGTATYYYHRHSAPLAEQVQRGMARRMGLADLGTGYRSVVVTRPTWFPAVLAEGATLVWPPHEAALREPRFQRAYARGVAEGLEAYFRALEGG